MPVKRASYKALRQAQTRRARNLRVQHQLKKLNVLLRKALVTKDLAKAKAIQVQFTKALDKASQHRVIHANTAARKKSRIAAAVKRSA